ncbi:hypothetical protein [Methylomicrobium lacus]|uniref:hypothetical protein n=1 Tax=Methylomicrobium lacus TaxID=136992 RepID=UPI0035A90716
MKEELNEKLFHEFPALFESCYGSKPKDPLYYWGIQCGDGWYELVHSVSELLTRHNPEIESEQIKEKFGGLRFYHTHGDDYASGVVEMAGHISFQICEACGDPGIKRDHDGYISTLCEKHKGRKSKAIGKDLAATTPIDDDIGNGWLRLIVALKKIIKWDVEKNGMPPVVDLTIKKDNGQLHVEFSGGDQSTKGMVDLIIHYSKKIDEHSGHIITATIREKSNEIGS